MPSAETRDQSAAEALPQTPPTAKVIEIRKLDKIETTSLPFYSAAGN
jgi:hypothetical protein